MTPAMLEDVVAFGYDRMSLDAIARPKTALAIWWRPLPDAVKAGLAALDLDTVDDVTLDLDADAPLDDTLRDAGYPDDVVTPACCGYRPSASAAGSADRRRSPAAAARSD